MPDPDRHRQRVSALMGGQRREWYRIDNKAGDVARVYLLDEIGYWGTSAADFVRELQDVAASTIELHISSGGGDVFEAITCLNALRQHPARVVAVVDGLAASAASFIACGADELVMGRNTELMLHESLALVVGNATDMRDLADRLDSVSDNIASIYAAKAGGSVPDWRTVMRAETWYTAEEAVAARLADRVDDGEPAQQPQAVDRSLFNYAGRADAPAPPIPSEGTPLVPTDETLTALRQRLGVSEDVNEAGILAALDEALEEVAEPPSVELLPAEVRAQLDELGTLKAERHTERRDSVVLAAVLAGRITPAERAGWAARYDVAAEATTAALNRLPAGRAVPLEPIGHDGDRGPADLEDNLLTSLFGGASR